MKEIIAQATDVEVIYGDKHALNKVNISVKKGDIYALVGKNGAGKTTLLRLLTGQNIPDYGHIELFGEKGMKGLNKARKRTGAIIETPAFYPFFSGEKNLEYYRIGRGIEDKTVVEKALKDVGLYEARHKKFSGYSLGMKQRLGIALALMHEPEFLILDEPINGLDPAGIVDMRRLFLRLNKEQDLTIIISSHILTELANMATCYGFIDNGVILKEMTAAELEDQEKSFLKIKASDGASLAEKISQEFSLQADFDSLTDTISVDLKNNADFPVERLSRFTVEQGHDLFSFDVIHDTLEDYFIDLVGGLTIE